MSSTEAEFVAGSEACKEGLYIRNLIRDMIPVMQPFTLNVDNQGSIYLGENAVTSSRAKHIDIRFWALRDWIKEKIAKYVYVPTDTNIADILTKALGKLKLEGFRHDLLVRP